MVRVQRVSGPATASAGDRVTYTVTAFDHPAPPASETAKVSWLIKTPSGAALTNLAHHGPELTLPLPATWAGDTAIVMPFMNAPSMSVSVRTAIARGAAPAPRPRSGAHAVTVAK